MTFVALAMAIGYTMFFSGLKKNALELQAPPAHLPVVRPPHRRRVCRSTRAGAELAFTRPPRPDER